MRALIVKQPASGRTKWNDDSQARPNIAWGDNGTSTVGS
jgi:hypothetical protein